ncbi:hypothetical protein [Escherichia coli]|uniref:hypothetical protein n=1 Tax=Escherichia coli TaxID=562 RepID=UPI00207BCAD3|nr:hypothetical protein [Escherichia coli]
MTANNNFITCKDASVTLKDRLNLDTKTGGKTWHYYVQQIFGGRPDPDLLFRQLVSDSYSYSTAPASLPVILCARTSP